VASQFEENPPLFSHSAGRFNMARVINIRRITPGRNNIPLCGSRLLCCGLSPTSVVTSTTVDVTKRL